MKQVIRFSRGQIAVIYALAITALVGVISLGADVALMYYNWQWMQKVADSAALAGANYLTVYTFNNTPATGCTTKPDPAQKAACTYAVKNGLSTSNFTLSEPSSTTIKVVAQQTGLPYFFGKVLGLDTYSVSALAVAQGGGSVQTVSRGLFPVGLQCTNPCKLSSLDPSQSYTSGSTVTFGAKFVGGLAPGNWQWMDFGNGDSGLSSAITAGATGSYTIGGSISSEPGNKGSSNGVKTAVSNRLSKCSTYSTDPCSGSNPANIVNPNDPCLVIVPAVDFNGCTGSCNVTIEGFAEIYMEPGSTSSTSINGCFVSSIVPDTIASQTAPNLGPYQPPILIQ